MQFPLNPVCQNRLNFLLMLFFMFDYRSFPFFCIDYTPYGVEHYTLWSVEDLTHEQVRKHFLCYIKIL